MHLHIQLNYFVIKNNKQFKVYGSREEPSAEARIWGTYFSTWFNTNAALCYKMKTTRENKDD